MCRAYLSILSHWPKTSTSSACSHIHPPASHRPQTATMIRTFTLLSTVRLHCLALSHCLRVNRPTPVQHHRTWGRQAALTLRWTWSSGLRWAASHSYSRSCMVRGRLQRQRHSVNGLCPLWQRPWQRSWPGEWAGEERGGRPARQWPWQRSWAEVEVCARGGHL